MPEENFIAAAGAQIEGVLVPNADGTYSRQGPIFHDQRMAAAVLTGNLDPLRPTLAPNEDPLHALAQGLSVNALLREDEWELFDRTVQMTYRDELVAFGDLASRGLTFNLGNAMGTTELKWEDVDEVSPAERSMYAGTQPSEDLPNFTTRRLPIPIISKGFHLDLRSLSAGRREGEAIDVTAAEKATRQVAESTDDLFINGGFSNAGINVFGYTTHPVRNTGSLTAAWSGATGEQIVGDVIAMVDAAFQDNIPGPFNLYVPFNYASALNGDFKADSDKTIRQRILEIEGVSAIRITRRLASTQVLLVSMRRDVVDAVVGFEPTLVQWETMGGMVVHFKVLSILVPRVKQDAEGRSGIVHFSE